VTRDDECAANQHVRLQNPDLVDEIRDNEFYDPSVGDEISPRLFVDTVSTRAPGDPRRRAACPAPACGSLRGQPCR
jgi:hypothetical protein